MTFASLKLTALAALTLALAPVAVQAADIVVPNANANAAGGSNNFFPINTGTGVAMRYQQVYASSQFGAVPVTLTALKFRQASDATGGAPFSTILPSIAINLSTSLNRVGSLSTTFADNIGANVTTVLSGAVAVSSTAPTAHSGVEPFDIVFTFATPFLYDPTAGDLLLDFQNFGGGVTTNLDFITGGSNVVGRLFSFGNANATTGFAQQAAGIVTAFSIAPAAAVPEPASWAMLIAGFGLTGAALRRRGKPKLAFA